MQAEQQKLIREFHRHSQSVKASLEAAEQRANADREQVCLDTLPHNAPLYTTPLFHVLLPWPIASMSYTTTRHTVWENSKQ